jgi:adenylate kinase
LITERAVVHVLIQPPRTGLSGARGDTPRLTELRQPRQSGQEVNARREGQGILDIRGLRRLEEGVTNMVRVVMLSPPGGGKGTHGRWLTQRTGAAHISSGDLLRAEVACGSDLGRQVAAYTARGDLVPDELIISILIPAVVAAARDTGGYVLDGFPRTMPQALRAAQLGAELNLTSDVVIYLTAPEEELVTRMLDRLAVFARETAPLVDYYRSRGILLELSTDRPEADVRADLQDWLEARGLMLPEAGESQTVPRGTRENNDTADR